MTHSGDESEGRAMNPTLQSEIVGSTALSRAPCVMFILVPAVVGTSRTSAWSSPNIEYGRFVSGVDHARWITNATVLPSGDSQDLEIQIRHLREPITGFIVTHERVDLPIGFVNGAV